MRKEYVMQANQDLKSTTLELKKEFFGRGVTKGFQFRQIRATKRGYLYEVTDCSIYYEVFEKRINKRFACISYPTSKSFGIWAWTYPNLENAIKRLNSF